MLYGKKPEEVPAFVFWKFLGDHVLVTGGFSGCPSMRSPSMRIFIGDRDDLNVAETKGCQLMKQFDAV